MKMPQDALDHVSPCDGCDDSHRLAAGAAKGSLRARPSRSVAQERFRLRTPATPGRATKQVGLPGIPSLHLPPAGPLQDPPVTEGSPRINGPVYFIASFVSAEASASAARIPSPSESKARRQVKLLPMTVARSSTWPAASRRKGRGHEKYSSPKERTSVRDSRSSLSFIGF